MLSRVAETLYWISRYMERAENVARIIDVNFHLILDLPYDLPTEQWEPLVITSGDEELFKERYSDYTRENVISFLTFDKENPNSIWSAVISARDNARTVREIISPEMWEEINNLYHFMKNNFQNHPSLYEYKALYSSIIKSSHLFMGLTDRTILRDEGLFFIRLARLLERADKTSRILDVKYFIILPKLDYVNTPYDDIQWAALLKSASAFEAYRRKHHRIEYEKVIDFLILDESFPRSVAFSVTKAFEVVKLIDPGLKSHSYEELRKLSRKVKSTTIQQIKTIGLHEYIDNIQEQLNTIGNSVYEDFF
jgi:uncharacterized alpha-E superfamily protein